MTDTAQPLAAAESVSMSREDALADAAQAFKASLGQSEPKPAPPAPEAAAEAADDEIEAPDSADPAEDDAESQDQEDDVEAAADDAQPPEVALPRSWPADKAELWTSLPPEAQAVIAEREGQRDAAVSLAYNIGAAAYCRSGVDRAFDAGEWRRGCDAFLPWNKARVNGQLRAVRGLTLRRRREREICLRGL